MTAISVTRLAPALGARVEGVDITRPISDAVFAEIRAAFEEHSVLVFHDQPFDDETQVAFSRRFGGLEVTLSVNPAAGTPFARQSNLDIKTGAVIPPDDRRMIYQRANMLWHSDSSFKRVPALCSLLSGRVVPPEGGATEFILEKQRNGPTGTMMLTLDRDTVTFTDGGEPLPEQTAAEKQEVRKAKQVSFFKQRRRG